MTSFDPEAGPILLKILANALREELPIGETLTYSVGSRHFSLKLTETKISIVEIDHDKPNWTVDL